MNADLLKRLRKKYLFAWDASLLLMAVGISGVLLLVFHMLMKRMLGETDYASLVSLLGLLNVLSIPVAAMKFTMSRFVAEHVHNNAVAAWVTIYRKALRKIFVWGGVALLVWLAFSVPLADLVAAPAVMPVMILGAIAAIRIYQPVLVGVLQGSRHFGYLALFRCSNSFLRLLFCVFAVWIGGRIAGVMGALALSIVVSLMVANIPIRRVVSQVESLPKYDTSPIYRYIVPVLLTQGAFLLLMNADIIFFKRFLYGEYGDLKSAYAQAATLSRSVIFLAGPLGIAMFPRAVNSAKKGLFFGPLLFAGAISGALALFITFFPAIPFGIMYGTDDPDCFAIARRYVWAAMPLSLVGIAIKYLWARHRTGAVLLVLPVVAVYLLVLYLHHRTPYQIVACLAVASWSALALLMLPVLLGRQRGGGKRRMLIVSLAGAGDTLMTTPLIAELNRHYPDAEVDILTMQGVAARDIVSTHPGIGNHYHYDFLSASWWESFRYCKRLRKRHYDISFTVMPQNRFEYNLITFLIGARERLGFDFKIKCGAMGNLFLTKRIPENTAEHVVENNLRLLSEGMEQPLLMEKHELKLILHDRNRDFAREFMEQYGLAGKTCIGFHPGSGTTKNLIKKRWPPDKWPELARLIAEKKNHVVLLFGSPDEVSLRETIIAESNLPSEKIIDVGNHPILDTAALLGRMDYFICNDALLTHVAAALKVPTVVVTGPIMPHSTSPYGGVPYKIVRTGIWCSPCYGYSKYGIECVQKEKYKCLHDIQAYDVYSALMDLESGK